MEEKREDMEADVTRLLEAEGLTLDDIPTVQRWREQDPWAPLSDYEKRMRAGAKVYDKMLADIRSITEGSTRRSLFGESQIPQIPHMIIQTILGSSQQRSDLLKSRQLRM